MPLLFIVVGIVMLVSAVRGTNGQLITLLKGDFTGKGNFIYWIAAIGILGALGYVGPLKTPARYMMALVLLVLFLKVGNPMASNGGVFRQFTAAINGEASQPPSSAPLSGNAFNLNSSPLGSEIPGNTPD